MFKKILFLLKKLISVYLIILIILWTWVYYYFFKNKSSSTETFSFTYKTVDLWNIKETISVVWTTELVNEQSIRFNKLWTVTKVNFNNWDKVKSWDIIAEIDNSAWQTAVKQAQISLDDAKLNLTELYKKANESQVMQSKNTISNYQKNIEISLDELENLKITQENSISDIKKNIDLTSKDLENLKITQANSLQDLETNIYNSKKELENQKKSLNITKNDLEILKSKLWNDYSNTLSNKSNTILQLETSFLNEKTNIYKIIEDIDVILWLSNKNKNLNDSYEIYISAKDTSLKNQAETYLLQSMSSYNTTLSKIDSYDNSWNIKSIKDILLSIQSTYKILQKVTDYTYSALDNSISSNTFSDTTISSLKSNIYSYKTNTESKISSINSSLNTLDTLVDTELLTKTNDSTINSKIDSINSQELSILKKAQDIISLEKNYTSTLDSYNIAYKTKENSLNTLKNNLDSTIIKNQIDLSSKNQSIDNLKKSLDVSKQSLTELLEWPTKENVAKANNSVEQAKIKLQDTIDWLKDYKLESPFDWIIRKIDYKVWDKLLSDSDKYVYIENPNLVQIPVMLDQVDIVKVEVGKKANIIFDAYPTINVEWTINSIDYTPVKNSWVVSYTAYLIITDKTFNKKILSWMTADIEITTIEKNNVLLLDSSSITTENNKYYVNLVKNWKTQKTEISIWLVSSWKTQIIKWLNKWDKIKVEDFSNKTTPTKTTTNSLFWPSTSRTSSNRSGSSNNNMWPPGWF